MPKGGKRQGAGRPQGSPNKAMAELKEAAQQYTQVALEALHQICLQGQSEAARVSAATAILDRAHGKPRQAMEVTGEDGGPIQNEEVNKLDLARWIAFTLASAAERSPTLDEGRGQNT